MKTRHGIIVATILSLMPVNATASKVRITFIPAGKLCRDAQGNALHHAITPVAPLLGDEDDKGVIKTKVKGHLCYLLVDEVVSQPAEACPGGAIDTPPTTSGTRGCDHNPP